MVVDISKRLVFIASKVTPELFEIHRTERAVAKESINTSEISIHDCHLVIITASSLVRIIRTHFQQGWVYSIIIDTRFFIPADRDVSIVCIWTL